MNTSESLKELLPALAAAKKGFAPAIKNAQVQAGSRSYKYVDLASVIDATEAALAENGLMVLQGAEAHDGVLPTLTLTTRVFHISGEWIETHITLPAGTPQRFDAQTVGSAVTYARRYSYMAILGIAPEDEDGQIASSKITSEKEVLETHSPKIEEQTRKLASAPAPESQLARQLRESIELKKQQAKQTIPDPDPSDYGITDDDLPPEMFEEKTPAKPVPSKPASGPFISEAQSKRFFAIAMSNGKTKEDINEALRLIGAKRSTEIPVSKYNNMCAWAAQ